MFNLLNILSIYSITKVFGSISLKLNLKSSSSYPSRWFGRLNFIKLIHQQFNDGFPFRTSYISLKPPVIISFVCISIKNLPWLCAKTIEFVSAWVGDGFGIDRFTLEDSPPGHPGTSSPFPPESWTRPNCVFGIVAGCVWQQLSADATCHGSSFRFPTSKVQRELSLEG